VRGASLLPSFVARGWPDRPDRALPRTTAGLALLAGAAGAALLPNESPGAGVLVVGLLVLLAAVPASRDRLGRHELGFGALAVTLLSVAVVRDAPWLVALCLLGAVGVGSFALAPGRSVIATVLGGLSVSLAGLRSMPWVARGVAPLVGSAEAVRAWWPAVRTAVGSLLLALVFGALFASADAAFSALLPDVDLPTVPQRAVVLVLVAGLALAVAFVAAVPPAWDVLAPRPARAVRTAEWAVPIAVLVVLFLAFVLVQLTVLFGGHRHVLETSGLTYAEYARAGFGQLFVVTVLTLSVIAGAARFAPRTTLAQRAALRGLLGALAVLALLVVASALYRLHLYEEAFGFTRLRLFMNAFESWLGVLLVLTLVAGVRLSAGWLPQAAVASAAAALLALAVLGGDGFVAQRNVDRWFQTGRLDLGYLQQLSADAVPAIDRLPEPLRSCALADVTGAPADGPGGWNLARSRARDLLERRPAAPPGACRVSTAPWPNAG
jgi:hypothetical protein